MQAQPDAMRLCLFGLLCCAPTLLLYVVVRSLPFPFEYAEGDTALWARLWRGGVDVYAGGLADLPLLRSNYPPLYLALLAALARGDDTLLLAGRLLSLAGFSLALGCAGFVAARASGARAAGVLSGLLLVALAQASLFGVTCRPDGLGLGLGVLGLTLVALQGRGAFALAGPCFAVALLCKHSLLVLPLGAGLWTLRRSLPRALGLALATAVPFLGALFAFAGFSRGRLAALLDMLLLGSAAPVSGLTLVLNLLVLGPPLAPLLWLALRPVSAGAAWRHDATMVGPFRASLLVGLGWSAALARIGAAGNHLLELSVCAAVLASCAAFAAGRPDRLRLPLGVAALASAILAAQVLVHDVPLRRAQAQTAAAALAGVRGLVLCEQSFHALQHRQVVIPFLATQQARMGRWDPKPLVSAIADARIERVVLGSPLDRLATFGSERIPEPVRAALLRRYRLLEQRGGLWIYGP